jgi:pyrroloquinoline quinone biosynthesis protein B
MRAHLASRHLSPSAQPAPAPAPRVQIILLGTAAGGGFPQWNCWCPSCRIARSEPARAHPRTQSSIAVSPDGARWFLVNASPDVREQLARLPPPPTHPSRAKSDSGAVRQIPVDGIILTDGELDHTLGLLLLREGRALTVRATDAVAHVLERDTHILPTLRLFAAVTVVPLPLDRMIPLEGLQSTPSGLSVEAFAVPGHAPRFAPTHDRGLTVGLLIRDTVGAGTLAYVPGCGAIDDAVLRRLRTADAVLFDGTCWSDDEMPALGISPTTSRAMGHMPISGAGGSLATMADLPARVRVYTHINNTNPVLIEDSPERRAVAATGVIVGDDGMMFTV